MKKLLLALPLLLLIGCGPDSELVASGRIHTCNLQDLQRQLQANPMDTSLQEQIVSTSGMLQSVIGTADEGGRADLQAAIAEAAAEGCD